jgi:hypothetical protein
MNEAMSTARVFSEPPVASWLLFYVLQPDYAGRDG